MQNIQRIALPQCHAAIEHTEAAAGPVQPLLLVSGGRQPGREYLGRLCRAGYWQIWAADHGLDACLAADVMPSRLIGDGDSAAPSAWQRAVAAGARIEQYPRAKDYTDTQLALQHAAAAGATSIVVTGALGGRFDHAYSNVHSAAHSAIPCWLTDDYETMFFLHSGERATVELDQQPLALSLLPLSDVCRGVYLAPARWPLTGANLYAAKANAVSNEVDTHFTVSLDSGTLAVYMRW